MVLSKQELDEYILEYYSALIEDPAEMEQLINTARLIVVRNAREFGASTIPRMHDTLSAILDYHNSEKNISLGGDLNRDGFTLYHIIPASAASAPSVPNLNQGRQFANLLHSAMPQQEFNALLQMSGGIENLAYSLGLSRLTANDILRDYHNIGNFLWLNVQPPEVREAYLDYDVFRRERRRYNPIQSLDSITIPIIKNIISEIHGAGIIGLKKELRLRKFSTLVRRFGVEGIVRATNPEFFYMTPYIRKWNDSQNSVQTALTAIAYALYKIPGYKEAEIKGNRSEQVRIINDFIKREDRLQEYFHKSGLGRLMNSLIDESGRFALRKKNCSKALLEFYNERKGLEWFDRSKETYVQAWRIRERGMWRRGQESAKLGVEAIEDVLYELPGYRKAEIKGNRSEQVRIINDLINREDKLQEYFYKAGLSGLMSSLFDPSGIYGLRKLSSPKALLEFYSERKGLDWFDRSKETYVQAWRIIERGKWNKDNKSVKTAVEAIEDVLYELLGYRKAESAGNRDEQVRIISELAKREVSLFDYFRKKGLSSVMCKFFDPAGQYGLRRQSSPKALLEFYSEGKGLEWFNTGRYPYLASYKKKISVVYEKAA